MIKYFISVFILNLLIVSCAGNCKYETLRREVSPDRKYIAVSYSKDCGAVAMGRPQVSILTLPDTSLPDKGNIVVDGLGIYVDKWIAPDTLILSGPTHDYKPGLAISKFGNINIVYRDKYRYIFYYYFSGYEIMNNIISFKLSSKPNSSNIDKTSIEIPVENLELVLEKGRLKQIKIINDFALKSKENLFGNIDTEIEMMLEGSLFTDGISMEDEMKLINIIK